jgi:hypothetical protein
VESRLNTLLHPKVSPRRFEDHVVAFRHDQTGKSFHRGSRSELVNHQVVLGSASLNSREYLAAWWAGVNKTNLVEERRLDAVREIIPKLVCPAKKGYVAGMLEVSESDQSRPPVRTSPIMRRAEGIEPDDVSASFGQLKRDLATDTSQANHRDIIHAHFPLRMV